MSLALASQPVAAQTIEVRPPAGLSLAPGAELEVPIDVDMTGAGGLTLASLELELNWDPALLSFVSATPSAPAGWTVALEESQIAAGVLDVDLSSPAGTTESFTAIRVTLEAADVHGQWAVLDLIAMAAADPNGENLLPYMLVRSGHVCIVVSGPLGDATDDGIINIVDAQQVARFAIGLATPNAPYVEHVGDANEDGHINIIDAQQIGRYSIGLDTPNSPSLGKPLPGCPNMVPMVAITSPADGSSHAWGAMITFSGTCTDVEDHNLTGDALVWMSSLDGQLGTGESFNRDFLSQGDHLIVLTATDSDGATGADTVAISVGGLAGLWQGGRHNPGLGLTFTVNPEGTGITEIRYYLDDWECVTSRWSGIVVRTQEYPGWPIVDGQIENFCNSVVSSSSTLTLCLHGTFTYDLIASGQVGGNVQHFGGSVELCSARAWSGTPATDLFLRYDGSVLFLSTEPSPPGESWIASLAEGESLEWSAVLDRSIIGDLFTFHLGLRETYGDYDLTLAIEHEGVSSTIAGASLHVPSGGDFRYFGETVWTTEGLDDLVGVAGDRLTLRVTYHGNGTGQLAFGGGSQSHVVVPQRITVSPPTGPAAGLAAVRGAALIFEDAEEGQQ
jgi:hypothetical protein